MKPPVEAFLRSPQLQWMAIGCLGMYGLVNLDHRALEFLQRASRAVGRLLPPPEQQTQTSQQPTTPYIINIPSGGSEKNNSKESSSTLLVVFQYGIGVFAIYYLFQNVLPEQLKQMLPVNRKVFDSATKSLTRAVLHVKETLGEQILSLLQKQDDLAAKQDETGQDVKEIKQDVKCVRGELADLSDSIHRCEDSLDDMHRLQSYTARGVTLLVDIVQSLLAGDGRMSKELRDYQTDGDILRKLDEKVNKNVIAASSSSSPPPPSGNLRNSFPEEAHPQRLITPGNPKQIAVSDTTTSSSSSGMNHRYHLYQSSYHPSKVNVQPIHNNNNNKQQHADMEVIVPNEMLSVTPEEEHPMYYNNNRRRGVGGEEAASLLPPSDSYLNNLLREFY